MTAYCEELYVQIHRSIKQWCVAMSDAGMQFNIMSLYVFTHMLKSSPKFSLYGKVTYALKNDT